MTGNGFDYAAFMAAEAAAHNARVAAAERARIIENPHRKPPALADCAGRPSVG